MSTLITSFWILCKRDHIKICTLVCLASYVQYYVWGIELNKGVNYKIRPLQIRYLTQYQVWLIISRIKAFRNLWEGRKGTRTFCVAPRSFAYQTYAFWIKQQAGLFYEVCGPLYVLKSGYVMERSYVSAMAWLCSPHPKCMLKPWSPVTILGDGDSKEVIKGKWGHKSGALIH